MVHFFSAPFYIMVLMLTAVTLTSYLQCYFLILSSVKYITILHTSTSDICCNVQHFIYVVPVISSD